MKITININPEDFSKYKQYLEMVGEPGTGKNGKLLKEDVIRDLECALNNEIIFTAINNI